MPSAIQYSGRHTGGFDELRKAMRQHGNIDYANIWIGSLTWLKHKASIQYIELTY